jgi:hypothetical protein
MNRATITYHGADLSVPEFLVSLWPHDLPLKKFPSFCGAGDGIRDIIVPEKVRGAILSPACFIHDIDWALAPSRSVYHFIMSNVHFLFNNRALVEAQLRKGTAQRTIALHLCNLYAFAVTSPIGWRNYRPEGTSDWMENLVLKSKLKRLAEASLGISEAYA